MPIVVGNVPKIAQNSRPLKVSSCVQLVCAAGNTSAAMGVLYSSPIWVNYSLFIQAAGSSFDATRGWVCRDTHCHIQEDLKHSGLPQFNIRNVQIWETQPRTTINTGGTHREIYLIPIHIHNWMSHANLCWHLDKYYLIFISHS